MLLPIAVPSCLAQFMVDRSGMITWEEFLVFASTQSQQEAMKDFTMTDANADSGVISSLELAQTNFAKIIELAAQ